MVGPLLVIAYGLFPLADSPCCQETLLITGGLWLLYATFHFPYDFLDEIKHDGHRNLDNPGGTG